MLFAKPVTIAANRQDLTVCSSRLENGSSRDRVGEHVVPFAEVRFEVLSRPFVLGGLGHPLVEKVGYIVGRG